MLPGSVVAGVRLPYEEDSRIGFEQEVQSLMGSRSHYRALGTVIVGRDHA